MRILTILWMIDRDYIQYMASCFGSRNLFCQSTWRDCGGVGGSSYVNIACTKPRLQVIFDKISIDHLRLAGVTRLLKV